MNNIKFNKIALFLVLFTGISTGSQAVDSRDDSHWVVAAVEGGAWKSAAHDPSVRTAVRAGDTILATDRLETFQNNQVALARDRRGQNIVAVRGAFGIDQSEKGAQVRLERGRALAVLDKLNGTEDFNIATMAGVAAVRGTRFTVDATAAGMAVKTFRGEVLLSAYANPNTASKAVGRSVSVVKGEKASFETGSKDKLEAVPLSSRDMAEYESQYKLIRSARRSLKAEGGGWFKAAEQPSRTRRVPGSSIDTSDAGKNGQTIVF